MYVCVCLGFIYTCEIYMYVYLCFFYWTTLTLKDSLWLFMKSLFGFFCSFECFQKHWNKTNLFIIFQATLEYRLNFDLNKLAFPKTY